MPGRLTPLVNDQIYHVFNRGINHQPTFIDKPELKRALTVLDYYRFDAPPIKLSKFLKLSNEDREKNLLEIKKNNKKLVEILTFCFMPNHFHFLLKQIKEGGISKFLANFLNSYTRFFNTKNDRDGSLFLDQFKAVIIETDEQLIHTSRYIHLNPLTSFVVKDFEALLKYPWSSLGEYLTNQSSICEINTVLNFFMNIDSYLSFLKDQAAYQQELHKIRHLLIE